MQPYGNRNGESGVRYYELGEQSSTVTFSGGDTYRYTYRSAGRQNVETMKKLAQAGQGLSTFISREVKQKFERKLY
jgi:hypothetical protein